MARAGGQHRGAPSLAGPAAAAPAGPAPRRRTRGPRRSGAGAAGTKTSEEGSEHARRSPAPADTLPQAAPSLVKPSTHLFQKLRRWPVVLLVFGPVRHGRRLGLTATSRGELRSLEALRPTLTHDDGGRGERPGWKTATDDGGRRAQRTLQSPALPGVLPKLDRADGLSTHGKATRLRTARRERGEGGHKECAGL